MFSALWVAKTGLDAQQTRMEVISNNLANVNTTGFKSSRASFQDLVYQNVRQPGGQTTEQTESPSGLMLGTGVRVVGTEKLFTQGNLSQTGNARWTSRSRAADSCRFRCPTAPSRTHAMVRCTWTRTGNW